MGQRHQAGPKTGRHVLQILQKRRVVLDAEDVQVMRDVVDTVHAEYSPREDDRLKESCAARYRASGPVEPRNGATQSLPTDDDPEIATAGPPPQ
jgi:hypothetical protein